VKVVRWSQQAGFSNLFDFPSSVINRNFMKRFKEIKSVFNTGLGRKLTTPILLVVAIFSVPFFFFFHMEQVVDASSNDIANRNDAIDHVANMGAAVDREQAAVYRMVFNNQPQAIADFQTAAGDVQMWHDEAAMHVENPEEEAALAECQTLHDQVRSTVTTVIIPAIQSSNPDQAGLVATADSVRPAYERITALHGELEGLFIKDRQASIASQTDAREFASEMVRASIVAAILLGLIVAVYYARRLIVPIKGMADASLKIARGDLSQRVEIKGRDELAEMGQSFNDMADSLERRTDQLEREKARIRAVHQSIGDGIVVVDRGGVIISVNPAAESILGKHATQLERTTNTGVPELQAALSQTIKPEQMLKCWEAKNCEKSDCPSHGATDYRCWLQCGTFCYNQIQGTFKQKRDACERCDVFKHNATRQLTLKINGRHYSTAIIPILDDYGQEEGRTVAMHDITEVQLAKEAVERHSAELTALNSVSEVLAESLDLDTTLENALDKILELTDGDAASVHLLDKSRETLNLVASRGDTNKLKTLIARVQIEGTLAGAAFSDGKPILVNDAREDRRVIAASKAEGFLSILAVPLKHKRKTIGVIMLRANRAGAFSEDTLRLTTLIVDQVAAAVENSRLYEDSLKHSREAVAKSGIASTLTSTLELKEVFDEFVRETRELVEFDRISVIAVRSNGLIKKTFLPNGMEPPFANGDQGRITASGTVVEWVVKNRRPYISGDISQDMGFREQKQLQKEGLRSQLNIPLVVKGKVLGSLNFASAKAFAYDDKTILELQPVADQVALSLSNQELFEDVARAKSEWETTFDSASEGIAMVSNDHHIVRLNRAAAEMMGGKPEDLIGRRCYEVVHKTGTCPQGCLMSEAVMSSATSRGEQETANGQILEIVVDPVYDEEGKPAGAAHFLRDITEAKRLRQQLLQSEKMIAVGQLVAGVAHEINNPLTGVMGYAQLLMARDIDDRAKGDAESIFKEAERATRIVRHLLSFARKHQPERRAVDINVTLRESLELKAYELRVNNIELETRLGDNLPMTNADPHQLQQVFLNLINNAEQAMLEDSGAGLLKISTQLQNGRIRIAFADTGPGIPQDMADRVFDPFYTTKDVGKGTGLGLSVCYGVAQDHGGRIWVEPVHGRGATVVLELPVLSAPSVDAEPEKTVFHARLGKILLVDDEAAIRQVLTETLKQAGHEVEAAGNGVTALKMLKQKHYDCVVSDVKMPGMDGPTLHTEVLGIDPDTARRFIFISGDTISPETRSYLDHIDNLRLAKPFNLTDLEEALQKVLATAPDTDD